MCHLILFTPVLALPIFWLAPLNLALPIYAVITALALLFYWLIAKSMGKRPEAGRESLIGAAAEVITRLGPGDHAQYLVRSQGELWSADSPDALRAGETVNISAVEGIRLVVRRSDSLLQQ
jgi:membrane protein implicated in regulation of membrane protease activity